MKAMAPIRPTELHQCRIRIPATPIAAAQARDEVSEAIAAWAIKVDRDDAVLLTSELVTNAFVHGGTGDILLTIGCCHCELRVDVHDTSASLPVLASAAPDSENGRGLMIVDFLADQWGYYRTPTGKSVFFVMTFLPELPLAGQPGLLGI